MERVIFIKDENVKSAVKSLINNLPVGSLDIVIRQHREVRTPSQNSLMWASAINDIKAQAWFSGKQFSAGVWHEYFKEQYMPENNNPELHLLIKDPSNYVKWVDTPTGERRCIASTTKLTKKGFSDYIEQIYAFGAELGVMFRVNENYD